MRKLQRIKAIAIVANRQHLEIIVHRVVAVGVATGKQAHHTMVGVEKRRTR